MDSTKEESMKVLEEVQPAEVEDMLLDSASDDTDDTDSDDDDVDISDLEDSLYLTGLQKAYKIMSEADIRECQERDISDISAFLSISRDQAAILLLHFNWDANAVPEEWFANEQKLREEFGLPENPIDEAELSFTKDMTCGICWGTFSPELVAGSPCGHIFCKICWAGYIGTSLKDGLPSLFLRCPDTSCSAAVGPDMVNMLASNDDKEKYARYLMISYIEYNPKASWCPSPCCNYAVVLDNGNNNTKVICKCSYSFCWRCTKEAHQPVSCKALCNWMMESIVQTGNWTMANTKGCPKCGTSFEMDGPFKRMKCQTCGFHFCKMCRTSWVYNGFWEGDQYTHICSKGKQKVLEKEDVEEQKKAAQYNLIRYQNCHMQWLAHEMHLQAAVNEVRKLQNGQLKALADKQGLTEAEFNFFTEAWLQIADCKRVLKWTGIYEYYLPYYEKEKRFLLNYLLRRAVFVVEQLYQCSAQLIIFFNMQGSSAQFSQFRDRLCLKTSVAENYFDNMVWAVENRISDLNSLRQTMSSRRLQLGNTTSATESSGPAGGSPEEADYKTCAHCQFPNDSLSIICVMCFH